MSRICVKNLPKHVAEERLKEFFSRKGEVTDAKLMRTKDGKSRHFAFVGYRTAEEAEEAIKYFNKSFMDTCRITCEIARKIGDQDLPRPWSKYSLKKNEKTDEGKEDMGKKYLDLAGPKKEVKKSKTMDETDDPLLQEFLEVMKPRSKSKLWANDTITASSLDQSKVATEKKYLIGKGDEKTSLVEAESDVTDGKEDELLISEEANKPHNVVHDEVISDMDYFKSRVKKKWSDSEHDEDDHSDSSSDEDDQSGNSNDEDDHSDNSGGMRGNRDSSKSERAKDVQNARERDVLQVDVEGGSDNQLADTNDPSSCPRGDKDEVLETARLFVRNLPFTSTEEELEEYFSEFGKVSEVHIVLDKETKRSKGIAYVLYSIPESAARALEVLDMSIFQGRLLHVMPAKQKNPSEKQELNTQSAKTLKQRREEERKASETSGNTQAWNTLYMRPDTVVENIARKFGVSKSDLLDKEADDLAVRIALGETQVIAETKKALAKAGVNVVALENFAAGKADGAKRSNHVILVKNLPYGSSESDLANLFGKFGSLDKVILPPTKTLALVIFLGPAEARTAFNGLRYKRYKDAPLYLEWAPGNILDQNAVGDSNNSTIVGEHDVKRVLLEQQVEGLTDIDVDPDRVESRSLYVKNLNFKTTDQSLKKHFTENMKEGKLLSIRVKKHMKNGKNVSMGFGFLEFDSVDTAVNVCKELQGTVLDGHALILQLCHAKGDEQVVKMVDNDRSSTKLLVRNVAFEATEKELRQLFIPFGQIKSLRLPMKFGNHRGFAFVEFVTKQEAQNALQALSNTHLYGRHLVIERAKEGESLEELRARTAAQFADAQNGLPNSAKISKKRKHIADFDETSLKFD